MVRSTLVGILLLSVALADDPNSFFTYQGQLRHNGAPANGPHEMSFQLYDAPIGGNQIGPTLGGSVNVANGLFSVQLSFGADPFASGLRRYLQITVNGTLLAPRQELTPAPFAMTAFGLPPGALTNAMIGDYQVSDEKISDVGWGKIVGAPTALPPTGAADGDLGGTYPSPRVTKLQSRPVSPMAPQVNQALKWNGVQWAPATDDNFAPVGSLIVTMSPVPPSGYTYTGMQTQSKNANAWWSRRNVPLNRYDLCAAAAGASSMSSSDGSREAAGSIGSTRTTRPPTDGAHRRPARGAFKATLARPL